MTVALMWEAKATPGHGPDLLAWTRTHAPAHDHDTPPGPEPLRRETFTAPGDRVLVITWWDAPYDAELPELPDPPPEFAARPVHRWRFERA
ncbi:hypothetical protein [Streptomyces daliensis]|uniref:Uncharacterized protein n=1 Tax=Streptomyces daliensis TaxID=299421 RepID=A0A8T4J054_9ACTN|nr:hypothetical protein [Streptomyces daliensis]